MQIHIENIGCFKNLVDSEHLLRALELAGFAPTFGAFTQDHADLAIINTCGFIGMADNDSSALVRQYAAYKREGRVGQVWVMGCYSEKYGDRIREQIPEVDRVFGNFNWTEILTVLGHEYRPGVERRITTPRHYAYLKISEGCNRPCAYCIKPVLNGPLQSVPMERVVEEAEWLVSQGVKELQLVAQNTTDYGMDLYGRKAIAELVERLSDIPGVEWIRLHYAYPKAFPMDLLRVMRERENVCKYLDIALQHCNTDILQRMHRGMTKEQITQLLATMRAEVPGLQLRTTMMVGFPGETEEQFEELCAFVQEQRFERMGVFRYSPQPGSYSATHYADDVPEEEKTRRALRLMEIQKQCYEQQNERMLHTDVRVIVDGKEGNDYLCRTEYSTPMADPKIHVAATREVPVGSFQRVTLTKSLGKDLRGEWCDQQVLFLPYEDRTIAYLPFMPFARLLTADEADTLRAVLHAETVNEIPAAVREVLEARQQAPAMPFYRTPACADEMRSMMVLPNNKCNFHCSYCYSANGRTNEEIDPKILSAGLRYFLHPDRARGKRLSVSVLGGGEPLLSWSVLRPALEEAKRMTDLREVKCPISLVTNGSICTDEIMDFLVQNEISLSVSFDILEDVQNAQRGAWKQVSENINRFADAGIDVALNTVISNENVARMTQMVNHLAAAHPKVKKVSFKTLISNTYFPTIEGRKQYYARFIEEFFHAKKVADEKGIWLTCSYMNTCICLSERYCPGKFVLTSEGEISICHTVGSKRDRLHDEFVFGRVDAATGEVRIDEPKLQQMLAMDGSHNDRCHDCVARWHCAGGCYADHFHLNEEEQQAYCESMRLFLTRYLVYKYAKDSD